MRQLTKDIFIFAGNKIFPALILTTSVASSVAQAAPQGGVIVGGQGSISTSTNTTNINQQTGSMVVDWSSFNVGSQETVNFIQPSSSASALNRIYDQNPSQILGAINANGRVFLSNPNGVVFGQTATVNVGALMATGLTISKDDFMNGNYHFNSDGYTPGAIINRGILTAASGGSISLVGSQVVNEGYIVADYGQINLATGKQAIVNFDGDGLISFQVSEDILTNLNDAESSVSNTGSLQANGGQILLDAHVAKDVFTNAVNNEGMIAAHRMENNGGVVVLSSNDSTINSGAIDVYGESGSGGSVFILGDDVALTANATVDASGDAGGGTILIGGDYQGLGDTQTAQFTTVEDNVVINANAKQSGDGGKVIVWADDTTTYHGQINARAEGPTGDGGFAEVSGKQHLVVSGHADLTSQNGEVGTLLLDPGSVNIIAGPDTDVPTAAMDVFTDGWINEQLDPAAGGGSSLIISTADSTNAGTEDLTLEVAAAILWTTDFDLTLIGNNSVIINGTIENRIAGMTDASGSLTLTGGSVDINGNITLEDGDFTSTGSSFDNTGATVTTKAGAINVTHTGDITVGLLTSSGGGAVTLDTTLGKIDEGIAANTNNIVTTGIVSLSAGGQIGQASTVATPDTELDVNATQLVVDAGSTFNIIVNNTLTDLTITTDADFGTVSDITATNLTNFDVSNIGDDVTITNVNQGGLDFSLTNTAGLINVGAITITTGTASLSGTNIQGITDDGTADISAATVNLTSTTGGIGNATTLEVTASTALNADSSQNAGNIVVDSIGNMLLGNIDSGAGDTTLNSTGTIMQNASTSINAGLLTTTSTGNTTLTSTANTIASYNGTSNTSGNVSITDSADGLVITGITSAGNATVVTTGALSQTGIISATTLTTSSTDGSTILNENNSIVNYNGTTVNSGNISLTDGSGNLSVTGITSAADVILSTFGTLTQAGAISAGTLTATSSTGSIILNHTGNSLTSFNGTALTSGADIFIANNGALDITGASTSTTAGTGSEVSITAIGEITQSGIISTNILVTDSTGANTTLTMDNEVNEYQGYTRTSGNISLVDNSGGLIVWAIDSAGDATLTTAGAMTQTTPGGTISANTLTTTSTNGSTTLTGANTISKYNGTSTGITSDITVLNSSAGGLEITGINAGRNASITTTGALTQSTGTVNAGTFTTVSNGGSTTLTADYNVTAYNGTTITSGDLSITDTNGDLNISGITSAGGVTASAANLLTISGDIRSANDINLAANKMALNANVNADDNAIDVMLQTVTAGTLIDLGSSVNTNAALELSNTELNKIYADNLTIGNSQSGAITFSQAINPVNITSLHLISSGAVSDGDAGSITGNKNLAIEAGGAVTFNNANNNVSTLAIDASTNGPNEIVFIDADALTIGDVDGVSGITGGGVTLTATTNDMQINNGSAFRDINATGTIALNVLQAEKNLLVSASANVGGPDTTAQTITADNMQIDGNIFTAGAGTKVILQSATNNHAIDLGVGGAGGAANTLELTNAELNRVTATTLVVGNADAGTIDLTTDITPGSNITDLHLITGTSFIESVSSFLGNKNIAITAGGNVTLNSATNNIGTIAIDATGFDVVFNEASNVTIGDVDTVSGITANNLTFESGKGATGQTIISSDITVQNTALFTATSSVEGNGTILADSLGINAFSVNLTSVDSDVVTLAVITPVNLSSDVIFTDNNGLTVGTVGAINGIDAKTVNLTVNTGLLTISQIIDGAAGVQLTADQMAINNQVRALEAGAEVVLQTATDGNSIDLGSSLDDAAGTLELSATEINRITSNGFVTVGDNLAGDITISEDLLLTTIRSLHLISGGNISGIDGVGGGIFINALGTTNLALTAGGSITLTDDFTRVNTLAAEAGLDPAAANKDVNIVMNNGSIWTLVVDTLDGVSGISGENITLIRDDNLTLNQAITAAGSGDIVLQGEILTTTAAADITSTGGDITITAGDLSLTGGVISSSGNLLIQQATNQDIHIGGNTTTFGALNISDADLALIQEGFNSLTFGNANTGNVLVEPVTFFDDVTINGNNMTVNLLAVDNSIDQNITGAVNLNARGSILGSVQGGAINMVAGSGGIGAIGNHMNIFASEILNADTASVGSSIFIDSASDLLLGLINAGNGNVTLEAANSIYDVNDITVETNNITANTLRLTAADGIGATNTLEIDVNELNVVNLGIGEIKIAEANNVLLTGMLNQEGDTRLDVANDLTIQDGTIIKTTAGGNISLFADNSISTTGAITVDSFGEFEFNQTLNSVGTVNITTGGLLNISKDITTTNGNINLTSVASGIAFGPDRTLTATGSIMIVGDSSVNGNLTFNANGVELVNALTVNTGDLYLNAGNDDLSISNIVTVNGGNAILSAADLDINVDGFLTVADGIVTISDSGNGMQLAGIADGTKLNISLNEYEKITAASLVLTTNNTLTMQETFQPSASLVPLTINANEMLVTQAGTVLGLKSNLDLADTSVNASADFTINVAGSFDMNNSVTTNGAFTLTAGQGITMGEPSSITSNNNQIDITANGGDILLGLVNGGLADNLAGVGTGRAYGNPAAGEVNITASAGNVWNNNGVFTDVTKSRTNIIASSTTIISNDHIGFSSTDAITIDANPRGLINLEFKADKAFINNLQNTRINSSGKVAVGLIFSGQIIGVGHNVGLNSTATEEVPADQQYEDSMLSVLGADYKLSAIDEEEEDSSTLNTVVPVMIRTKDGWEFKVPLTNPGNKDGLQRKVNWL